MYLGYFEDATSKNNFSFVELTQNLFINGTPQIMILHGYAARFYPPNF